MAVTGQSLATSIIPTRLMAYAEPNDLILLGPTSSLHNPSVALYLRTQHKLDSLQEISDEFLPLLDTRKDPEVMRIPVIPVDLRLDARFP